MSCFLVQYQNGKKVMRPVLTREAYLRLRSDKKHVERVRGVRQGKVELKGKLLQFNYSCIPREDGLLKGCQTPSTSFGMDIDHVPAEDMQVLGELIVENKDELGLLMLERSVRGEGYHLVLRRHPEMTQEQNLSWASKAIGIPFDEVAKDITRVFYATTNSEDDLIYLNDELFIASPAVPNPGLSLRSAGAEERETSQSDVEKGSAFPEFYDIEVSTLDILKQVKSAQSVEGNRREGTIPYSLLVECLQELLGGVPAHGSRNNFIFSMAAYLRYVCNDDPEWIKAVLPTYGENHDKWARTIESACQRAQYKAMPSIVKRAIENARKKSLPFGGDGEGLDLDLPPQMPKKLPKLIQHLTKNVPEVCRPAVANAVFPALAAHLKNVKFWLIDGTEKEATFMCVTMAKQSSGKSAVNKPIEYIVADIVECDELNRKREQEWKDATSQKGANKEKPKRPDDLCVQVLVSDMTNAAFVQRMKDANGRYLYTNLEELDLLKQLQTNGTKDVGKIICLCFDNGKYGQERVGTQSVTARVDIRWNWNASSTIQKGVQFFKGRMVDGTLSRVNFCTIIPDKSKPFVYGKYDDNYADTLKPYITNLNLANGHIECKQALDLAQKMQEKCQEDAALTDDEVLEDLAYRAVTIAYLKAMVLYICNDMTWTKDIAEFTQWSLEYDLWCKQHFFGQHVSDEKAREKIKLTRGKRNLLELLPTIFTLNDANEVRRMQGLDEEGCRTMIKQWRYRGYIEHDHVTGNYIKSDKYLKDHK